MSDENPASSVAERVRVLLELARMRQAGQRVWLVATAKGLKLLTEDAPDGSRIPQ